MQTLIAARRSNSPEHSPLEEVCTDLDAAVKRDQHDAVRRADLDGSDLFIHGFVGQWMVWIASWVQIGSCAGHGTILSETGVMESHECTSQANWDPCNSHDRNDHS